MIVSTHDGGGSIRCGTGSCEIRAANIPADVQPHTVIRSTIVCQYDSWEATTSTILCLNLEEKHGNSSLFALLKTINVGHINTIRKKTIPSHFSD